jgi:hypothetical protein
MTTITINAPEALSKDERRIIETALYHYGEALSDTANMMRVMHHYSAHKTCVEERGKTISLLDKLSDCERIELWEAMWSG